MAQHQKYLCLYHWRSYSFVDFQIPEWYRIKSISVYINGPPVHLWIFKSLNGIGPKVLMFTSIQLQLLISIHVAKQQYQTINEVSQASLTYLDDVMLGFQKLNLCEHLVAQNSWFHIFCIHVLFNTNPYQVDVNLLYKYSESNCRQ